MKSEDEQQAAQKNTLGAADLRDFISQFIGRAKILS